MRGILMGWDNRRKCLEESGVVVLRTSSWLDLGVCRVGVDGLVVLILVSLFMVVSLSLDEERSVGGASVDKGVEPPESEHGGLSVHILSLSLSDSSPPSILKLELFLLGTK